MESKTSEDQVRQRFFKVLDVLRITPYQLSKEVEISQASVSRYKTKATKKFKSIPDVCSKYGINAEWVYRGTGEMLLKNVEEKACIECEAKDRQIHKYENYIDLLEKELEKYRKQ